MPFAVWFGGSRARQFVRTRNTKPVSGLGGQRQKQGSQLLRRAARGGGGAGLRAMSVELTCFLVSRFFFHCGVVVSALALASAAAAFCARILSCFHSGSFATRLSSAAADRSSSSFAACVFQTRRRQCLSVDRIACTRCSSDVTGCGVGWPNRYRGLILCLSLLRLLARRFRGAAFHVHLTHAPGSKLGRKVVVLFRLEVVELLGIEVCQHPGRSFQSDTAAAALTTCGLVTHDAARAKCTSQTARYMLTTCYARSVRHRGCPALGDAGAARKGRAKLGPGGGLCNDPGA